jgi:DNA-binding transcriptional regulator LsrR (DeoR family)
MSGAIRKGMPRNASLLESLPDSAFIGKQSTLAKKYGVSESVISRERQIRNIVGVNDYSQALKASDKLRLREARRRIYELHFVVGKTAEEIAQAMNLNANDVRITIGKMRL